MSGGTYLTISGSYLGINADDVEMVTVHANKCLDVVYIGASQLKCTTAESDHSGEGPVQVYTISGGASNDDIVFNFVPGLLLHLLSR